MTVRFWNFARPYAGTYALGLLLLLATNALSLWIPWLLRDAIHGIQRGVDASRIAAIAATIVGVAVLQAVARTASRLTILGASRRIVHDVRDKFFRHLQQLGAAFYDAQRTGDIMSRGVNDLQLLQSFYGPGALNLINTSIVYIAVMVLLFRLDPTLTLAALMLYPPLLFVINRLSRKTYARSLAVQEQLATISNHAQENLSGIQQIKTYSQEEREIERFRGMCAEFRVRNLSMAVIRGAMISVIGVAAGLATLIVLFLGGRHVIEGRISFGDFVAFNAYLSMLAWPTIAMGWIINVFQRGAGAMHRVEEFLAVPVEVPGPGEGDERPERLRGSIEIRGLTFVYPNGGGQTPDGSDGRPVLRDVHLTVRPGEKVALVGEVGSGKSTLVNLLARIYPPPRGTMFIDGQDLLDIPLERLRWNLGYVPQESFLFSQSIRDNIALRHRAAGDAQIGAAVRLANLEQDVARFPDGLDTMVGERGVTLSGGQRQRVALARALLGEPQIFLLDDSLSSVDADTERAILDGFLRASDGRTCLFISHRLSTLAGMDRIVVLDKGRVVEQGAHGELMAAGGLYARLFVRQQLEQELDAS